MAIKEITQCPKNKRIKVKGKKCSKCEYFNKKKWYSRIGEVSVFCTYDMTETEKKYLK